MLTKDSKVVSIGDNPDMEFFPPEVRLFLSEARDSPFPTSPAMMRGDTEWHHGPGWNYDSRWHKTINFLYFFTQTKVDNIESLHFM